MSLTRVAVVFAVLVASVSLRGEQVPVRHPEGLIHGFLRLSTLDGVMVAEGDQTQHTQGDRVTTHVAFRFKDGSTHDQTTVFSQRGRFQLISDHLVQKGPTFPDAVDMTTDMATGRVTVRYMDKGEAKVDAETMKLPADLANGMVSTLLKNLAPGTAKVEFSMTVATPKPRLVKLIVTSVGDEPFATGGIARKATHYVVKIDLGGIAGALAPVVGKQPPDSHAWILGGDTPAFVKAEGPLFREGPSWRIELMTATWPR